MSRSIPTRSRLLAAASPATPSAVDFPRAERFSRLDQPSTTGHSGRVADPAMKSGEHFVRRFWANKTQGSRALGGHLILTNQRLLFRPNKLDSATGGHSWECQLQTISNTAIAPRGHNPFDGSLRRRLVITTGSEVNYFVVWKVSKVISAIQSATAQ